VIEHRGRQVVLFGIVVNNDPAILKGQRPSFFDTGTGKSSTYNEKKQTDKKSDFFHETFFR
jgi:hypothetical protein